MVKVSGDATIRAATEDYKDWQLLLADGVTPISLEGATKVTMRLKNESDGSTVEYATDDASPILEMLAPLADGKVRLKPLTTTFPNKATFIFHWIIEDAAAKKIPIPEDRDERLKVLDNYPPSP